MHTSRPNSCMEAHPLWRTSVKYSPYCSFFCTYLNVCSGPQQSHMLVQARVHVPLQEYECFGTQGHNYSYSYQLFRYTGNLLPVQTHFQARTRTTLPSQAHNRKHTMFRQIQIDFFTHTVY
jgi:hypothetical protein